MKIAPAIALLLLGGCSVIVQPGDDRVRCEIPDGGMDPCGEGERCIDEFCTPVECGLEVGCNGLDDDCDMTIDEGSDGDGDGFTWCENEHPERRDCRDNDENIYPGAPDDPECDGVDNDCDGTLAQCDDGYSCNANSECQLNDCSFAYDCPSGHRCDIELAPPSCVAIEVGEENCRESGCDDGEVCDPNSLKCVPPLPIGSPCTDHEQCGAGTICMPSTALALNAASLKVCSRACCSNADCPADTICWAPSSGARGCIPPAMVGGEPGYLPCGGSSECGANECILSTRAAGTVPSWYAFICGPSPGEGDPGAPCYRADECKSLLCANASDFYPGFCSGGCGSHSECGPLMSCTYATVNGGNYFQTCLYSPGTLEQGSPCNEHAECRSWSCIAGPTGSKYCADACCTDADCPAEGYGCRPLRVGEHYEMLCVPR